MDTPDDDVIPAATLDYDQLSRVYVKMRDHVAEKNKEHDAYIDGIKAKMARIEAEMQRKLLADNAKSMRTASGTFYIEEVITPTGADWDAVYRFIADNNAFEFLERRITKTAVKQYMEDNEGALPPGVSVHRENKVRVRRNS